jgi:hypothetical protein
VDAESAEFVEPFNGVKLLDRRAVLMRNGYPPGSEDPDGTEAGYGEGAQGARDRSKSGIKFHFRLLAAYLQRTRSLGACRT